MLSTLRTAQNQSAKKRIQLTVMIVLLIVGALADMPSLEAAVGFNVNTYMTFDPHTSTYHTTDPNGCPPQFVAKFTFTALLGNKPASAVISDLVIRASTLMNGNILLAPQTNAVLGGVGAEMKVPEVGQYADGLLSPGESVDVPFVLCLRSFQPFQFFVDVFGGITELVSINAAGTNSGNLVSNLPSFSPNGRFIVFNSDASDLTPLSDTNGAGDVFLRDLQTGTTSLVSVNRDGTRSGNGVSYTTPEHSTGYWTSADGRFVVFTSRATDLTATADTNGTFDDVFVRDMQTGRTTLVSSNRFGTGSGNGHSGSPVISNDGRFVLFSSDATDLVSLPSTTVGQLFLRDLSTGITTMVSVDRTGTKSGNGASGSPAISTSGRFVAFASNATDLVATPAINAGGNIFVRDLQTGTTTLVSINAMGTSSGNNGSFDHAMSADGRFIVFSSFATDLTTTATNGRVNVFVRDQQMGITTLASVNQTGTAGGNGNSGNDAPAGISANGRFVVFSSRASDLVANDSNGNTSDNFMRDLQTATTTLVSVNFAGTGSGNNRSGIEADPPLVTADGRFVVFRSFATDLVAATDTNSALDIFVRDLTIGRTTLVSINRFGTSSGNSRSGTAGQVAAISQDGHFLAFSSSSSDLVENDGNATEDVFVRPVP